MSCACGMDSVGTCLVCGARLCPEHALRGSTNDFGGLVRTLGVSLQDLPRGNSPGTFPISLNGVRSDLRPLFRFPAQRKAFLTGLGGSGVICGDCRINGACAAAGATPQPTAPALEAGGSQRLRDAAAAYLLGDMVAWDSMASDAAVKDALFQDLIHLARERAERVQVPVEWDDNYYGVRRGEVRATEEVFHVVDVTVYEGISIASEEPTYRSSPQYMNRYGQWGPIRHSDPETVKTGWFSKEQVFRASWSDKPPQPELLNVLKRAAELLAPAA